MWWLKWWVPWWGSQMTTAFVNPLVPIIWLRNWKSQPPSKTLSRSLKTGGSLIVSRWMQPKLIISKGQLQKCTTSSITVNGEKVERSTSIKFLGTINDELPSLRQHIVMKRQKASYGLQKIRLIRPSLTVEACKQVVHGLVLSHLDFCNGICMGLRKTDIQKMPRIQNTAAKLILNQARSESSTEALKALHWLPIQSLIDFKILIIVHKCLHGHGPAYLQRLLVLKEQSS